MKTLVKVLQMLIRLFGLVLLVLGVLFWTGNLLNLIVVHMIIGIVLVASLWVLAIVAAQMGVPAGPVIVAMVWGLIGAILGLTQASILPTHPLHWVVQAVHLLVGIGIIEQGESLSSQLKEKRTPALQR
jgi:hypothetical protein